MTRRSAILPVGLIAVALTALGAPAIASATLKLKRIASLPSPTSMTTAPGFPRLVFLTERAGRIRAG